MRGSKGVSPRHSGRKEADDNHPPGGEGTSVEHDEDNELPDLIMDIDDDVLDDRDYDESESQEASVSYKSKTQGIFMGLALLGLLVCIVLLCLVAYFATTYSRASDQLKAARDNLRNATENHLKLRQQLQLREEQHCTQFQNSTEHWLHLFCEKYECPSRICEPGWFLHLSSCYIFTNTSLTWEQSREACAGRQSQLVVIGNDKVQNFLSAQAKEKSYWIGMTDVVSEGSWIWVDGTKVIDRTTFWAAGQPDNAFNRTTRRTENCGILSQHRWYDESCLRTFPAICERTAIRLHLVFQRIRRSR
uniref:C-type lectin domain family 4 member E-like n=1 Tax=Pristiophorus japonicus TaxID=55135 RepID=UPI00398E55C8